MTGKTGPLLAVLTVLASFFSAITPARATSDGLIAHWQFDETSGTTAADSKGGNDGTLVNGPVWQPTGGHIGGAVYFDGVDDYVTIPSHAALDNLDSLSVCGWFYIKSGPGSWRLLVSKGDGSNGWNLYVSSGDSSYGFQHRSGDYAQPGGKTFDEWQHFCGTAGNGFVKVYRNGVLGGSVPITAPLFNDSAFPVTIGAGSTGWLLSRGPTDDVRIYNRALSAAEVLELYNTKYCAAPALPESVMIYNACCKTYQFCNGTDWVSIGSAPHCTSGSLLSNLVAHWKLDESSGTTAADSAGSNNGTLTNGPVWTTGHIGGAVQFDGTNDYISLSSYDFGNQFTLAAWVNINPSEDNIQTVIANATDYCESNGFKLFVNTVYTTDAVLRFETGNGTVCDQAETAAGIVPADGWHHIVASVNRTAGSATLYVDGVDQTTTSTIRTDFNTNGVRRIGSMTNGVYPFGGTIDDVRIYDRALSAAEVGQIYNGTDMCP